MADKGTYYLTTAIAYTSRKPHIGNTYEIILSDAIARMRRAEGYDVRFMTGTDEHGQKVEQNAKEAGVEPKQYVDKIAGEIKSIWDLMNTSYDRFIRTTDEDHVAQVQKIFKKLYDQGDIYLSKYEGWYCTACESFFTETQVVDGKCPDCGRPVQRSSEEAYFFRMSKYSERLLQYIEDQVRDGSGIEKHRIFITHAGCDQEIVDDCVSKLKSLADFEEIDVTRAGCTVSSHCGRNTLGVLFIRDSKV